MSAWFVIIKSQSGPQMQVWYDDGGRFVGPALETVKKVKLPERESWTIAEATQYVERNP